MVPAHNRLRWHWLLTFRVSLKLIPQMTARIETNRDLPRIEIQASMPGQIVSALPIPHDPHRTHPSWPRIPIAIAKNRQQPEIYVLPLKGHLFDWRFPFIYPSGRGRVRHAVMMLQDQVKRAALLQVQSIGQCQQAERIEIARGE